MRIHNLLLLIFFVYTLQGGKIYNPIVTRDEIINFYHTVLHGWSKDLCAEQEFLDVVNPLFEDYLLFVHHFDQFVGNGCSIEQLEEYIRRIYTLHKKITSWLKNRYTGLDFEVEEDEQINTPSYQNLSGEDIDYENQDVPLNWIDFESQ